MSGLSFSGIFSSAKSFLFGEEVEAKRNPKVRLADPDAMRIDGDTGCVSQFSQRIFLPLSGKN